MGDKINELFGINTSVGGVLAKTNSFVDDFHFLSDLQFNSINADPNRVYIKLSEKNLPEMFYFYSLNETKKNPINLSSGDADSYVIHDIAGKRYYPLILGFKDAKEMIKEKEISGIGDRVDDFGKSFIVIGIASETNTSLDMMHIIPLSSEGWS